MANGPGLQGGLRKLWEVSLMNNSSLCLSIQFNVICVDPSETIILFYSHCIFSRGFISSAGLTYVPKKNQETNGMFHTEFNKDQNPCKHTQKSIFLFSQKTAILKEISASIQPNKQLEKKQTPQNNHN